MARQINRLSPRQVVNVAKPGYYADGGGLYLQVSPAGAKSWVFRFTLNGRAREMGVGSFRTYTLAEARDKAIACRKQLDDGIDPIEARNARLAKGRLEAAKALTFAECAEAYIEAHRAGWRNPKHASQWTNTLATYASKKFGSLSVQHIDTGLVMRALEPIWRDKPETASRLRGRIECVLDWATVRGLRQGDNPARWRGHLDSLLPAKARVKALKHHAALPYAEIGDFVSDLRSREGMAAAALEFTILTAARTGETIGATWDEIDLDSNVWSIPAARMKAQREHRVPLSPNARKVLNSLGDTRTGYVFSGAKARKPLSNMAMLALLGRMGRADLTVHGFRSTFRDWAAEQTNFAREVAEGALAHVVADKVEAAYRRSDLFEKRRMLMNAWSRQCEGRTAPQILSLQVRRSA